jgi:hypothetical protein
MATGFRAFSQSFNGFLNSSGNFASIRRASSLVSNLAAERRPGSSS